MDIYIPTEFERCHLLLAPVLRLGHSVQVPYAIVLWVTILVVNIFSAELCSANNFSQLTTRFIARRSVG